MAKRNESSSVETLAQPLVLQRRGAGSTPRAPGCLRRTRTLTGDR